MSDTGSFEILAVATPGLESAMAAEMAEHGFAAPTIIKGGVRTSGPWREAMRANLELRGATRILVRIGGFRALHPAQLDKRARRFPWGEFLRKDVPAKVEARCSRSRIYHAGAAKERIARAIAEELGATVSDEAALTVKARIDDDLCTFSIDMSGEPLHKRGFKVAVNKAPMRETMAALFLRRCGYRGTEPVVDPMCGSGTFVIEAAEWAAGLQPGRARRFAFEDLANFDPLAWAALHGAPEPKATAFRFYGGAVKMSGENAARAGIDSLCTFRQHTISDLAPPGGGGGPPGLVIVNPPYGGRIGDTRELYGLYGAFGKVLKTRFAGWRAGLVTNEPALAHATGLPFLPMEAPILHGGLKVMLYRTDALSA